MIPITPSNFFFYYSRWIKKLNLISDKNQKNIYATKIARELFDFSHNCIDNTLAPYVKNWCDRVAKTNGSHITSDVVIKGLKKIKADDDKLIIH